MREEERERARDWNRRMGMEAAQAISNNLSTGRAEVTGSNLEVINAEDTHPNQI